MCFYMSTDSQILEVIKASEDVPTFESLLNNLTEKFYNELLTDNDKNLLKFLFSQSPTQAQLDEFLSNWDIEVAGAHKALLLSYFMKEHPSLHFTKYEEPRLNGLLKFYRFQNLKLISHYTKIGQNFNKADIPVMILKGGAMKYYRPDLSRNMGDIDILVPEKDYQKAGKIVEDMGYDCAWDIHSVDLHLNGTEEGICDIHKYIFMDTGCERNLNKGLFERAKKAKVFGVDSLVPCHEDMFFIALVNMARNMRNNTSSSNLLFTIFDCRYLLESKHDFDWNIVINDAVITKTQVQVNFALNFINRLAPGLIPNKLDVKNLFEKETDDYCTIVMYNRFFIYDMKMRCRELKIQDALKNLDIFKEYITLKPKYFFLKQFRRKPLCEKIIMNIANKLNK